MERMITTPFGQRSMTLAMLASQSLAEEIEADASVDKWKLYRALCDARPRLGVTDRGLALLNALLSFYPKPDLSLENGLVVFPSNQQLSARAHGMAEQTIRRHLAVLVDCGLIARKDSANGKRYARRDRAGSIDEAFGFSLAPLLARADEIERIAAEVVAERLVLQRLKERLTICRRDIAKLIAAALEEGVAGNWERIHADFRALVDATPRHVDAQQAADFLDAMQTMREEIVNILEMQVKSENPSGNDRQNERHIQNSKPDSISELEPLSEKSEGANTEGNNWPVRRGKQTAGDRTASLPERLEVKSFPLGMVLSACPQILDYGPGGGIASWRELMAAAVVVRSMLGVSPSAYQEACETMGPENAATVMACILERAGHIHSAGGYLRTLTERARKGEFGLGPMLMALMKVNAGALRQAG